MPLLNDAKALMLGCVPVKRVYRGCVEVWSPPCDPDDEPEG